MISDDILIAIGILESAILGWLVAGMVIRSRRARLVEPGDSHFKARQRWKARD